jgi:hypothetical protein
MKTLKITLLFCLFAFIANAQTVHTVDNRTQSGALFTSLQDAVDAATAGDIIQIHPSATSYGNVTIGKTLNLVGLGHDPITNNQGLTASINALQFFGTATNSEIRGLIISSISLGGGTANNLDNIHIIHNKINIITGGSANGLTDSWVIEGNYITSTSFGVSTQADGWIIKNNFMLGGVANLKVTNLVRNNIFFSTSNSADNFFSNCTSILISNNIFVTNGNMTEFGISNSSNLDFRNNLTYSYVGNPITALPGTGNLDNTNPMFVMAPTQAEDEFYDNDYHLAAGSPGLNYGTDGTDIGIFGNNFLFDNTGRPDLMPYPTSITINNNVVAPGQDLNVNFTAVQKQ